MSDVVISEDGVSSVVDAGGLVEVHNVSADDVRAALALYREAAALQTVGRAALRDQLLAMVESRMPLVPEASQRQLQRTAALRRDLLAHGFETYATLADRQDKAVSSARTWVASARGRRRLFTVPSHGHTVIPVVQLTDNARIRDEIADLTQPLLEAGLDGWSLWAWLCSPTGWLSGEIPADVARAYPDRARKAAHRYARQLAEGALTGA